MFKRLMHSGSFRRRTSYLLAAVLIPPFVIFFHTLTQQRSGEPGGIAGKIFGRSIPWESFKEHKRWVQRLIEQQLGELPQGGGVDALITKETWDRLMLLEEAKRKDLKIDDATLASFIRDVPAFKEEGYFVPDRYRRFLAALGTTPQRFESSLREDLLIQKLIEQIRAEATLTDEEVQETYVKENERRQTSLILITPDAFKDAASNSITEEDLRTYYDTHPKSFEQPAEIMFDWTGLTRKQLSESRQITDEEVSAYYADHPEEFSSEDKEKQHPLDEVREDIRQRLSESSIKKRLVELALDLEDTLAAGWRMEEIALGYQLLIHTVGPIPVNLAFVNDAPEPELLQEAYSLKMGTLSDVLETDKGIYLLRLRERIPERLLPFEQSREKVAEAWVQERSRKAAQDHANLLRESLALKHTEGLTFEEACLVLGLSPKELPPFTRTESVEGLGRVPVVNDTVFATPPGQLTNVADVPQGFALLWVEEHLRPEEPLSLENEPPFREQLLNEHEQQHLSDWLNQLRDRAKLESFVEEP